VAVAAKATPRETATVARARHLASQAIFILVVPPRVASSLETLRANKWGGSLAGSLYQVAKA